MDFNGVFLPYSNEVVTTVGNKSLSSTTNLSGGFSLGIHAGAILYFGNYVLTGKLGMYSLSLTEDELYDSLENGEVITRNRITKHYPSNISQVYVGLGVKF